MPSIYLMLVSFRNEVDVLGEAEAPQVIFLVEHQERVLQQCCAGAGAAGRFVQVPGWDHLSSRGNTHSCS